MRYLFLLVLSINLIADPKDAYTLAVTEGEPSSLVEGTVSAITGDLYISEADAIIQGCVPVQMPRHYISGDGKGKRAGWIFVDHLFAEFRSDYAANHYITIKDLNGTSFTYQGSAQEVKEQYEKKKYEKKKHTHTSKFFPPDTSKMPGLTNTAQGHISALTNLKNAYIKLEPDAEYFHLLCPDGSERCYRNVHDQRNFEKVILGEKHTTLKYILQWEKLTTGTMVLYGYDKYDNIDTIRTAPSNNPNKTYACASFKYHDPKHIDENPSVDIHTSDGRKIQYRFDRPHKHKNYFLLGKVTSPECPEETISYHGDYDYCGRMISRRHILGNRYYDIDYYRPKHNNVGGSDVQLKKEGDPRCLRVKTLSAPVGTDATPIVTHKFYYYPENYYTDVREIDNQLTRYQYSSHMRLDHICRFGKNDALTNVERFSWRDDGCLNCRSFFDSECSPLFARRFIYDAAGNVLEEKFYGNLSGQPRVALAISSDSCPIENGAEVSITRRQYSQDGRNLLLREEDPSGKVTLYNYLPNASLLSSKFICDQNQIKIRHFYEYNQDLVVVREIMDDGSTADPNNLTGVKTRKIKMITLVPAGPFVNMPQIIEEKYWNGSQEVPLRKTALSYTTGGLIDKREIYDSNGDFCYRLTSIYDGLGRLREETNAIGQTAKYEYDEVGNNTLSIDPSGRKKTVMAYDYSNRLTRIEEIGFDGVTHITQHRYDGKHNTVATIDHFGNETTYDYDTFGHLLATHLPLGHTLSATYDDAGREITSTDANKETTTKQYNSRNQITFIQHPDKTQERFIYNIDGTLRTHIDQEGVQTSYTYDFLSRKTSQTITSPNGKTLSQESFIYDSFNLVSKTDAEGNITTYTYDKADRKIAEEQNGERFQYSYDSLGRLHCVQTEDLLTFTEYDFLDRVIEERKEDTSGNLLSYVAYGYDAAGNKEYITHIVMGEKVQELFSYDSFNRLIKQTDPLKNETNTTYDENHRLQKITTDPLGLQTIETYDALNRLISIETKNAQGQTRSLEQKEYDPNGNVICQTSTVFPSQRTVKTHWKYSLMNRLSELIEAGLKNTRYTYTPKGLVSETFKPDGVSLKRTYDPLGNLLSLTSSDNSISYTYRYNKLNQLLESKDLNTGTTTLRTLDTQGRILKEKLANNLTLASNYDPRGRRTNLTLPDQSLILYNRDALHLRGVVRQDSQGFTLYTHLYNEYDLSDHLLSQTLIGDLGQTTFSIDPIGRTTALVSPHYNQQVLQFDPVGNPIQVQTKSVTSEYSYDDLYQVTEEKGLFNHTYSHDSHYNRLQKDDSPYQLNSLNQLSDFVYDLNGNPISHQNTTYTYDALDRLITVTTPTHRIAFTYDSFHRRLSKTVTTAEKTTQYLFLYDGQNEIGATDTLGNIIELRILGATPKAEIGAAIALELNHQVFAPIHDLFGNLACLVSLSNRTHETYYYSPFGETLAFDHHFTSIPTAITPWLFSSKRLDSETNLIFYGRRYYDPTYGRWLTPDPKGFEDSMNLYAFVYNNSLTDVDLYGLFVEPKPVQPPSFQPPKVAPPKTPIAKRIDPKQIAIAPIIPPSIIVPSVAPPSVHSLSGRKEHPFVRLEFGHGITYSPRDAKKAATYISDLAGKHNVHYVYNPTIGFTGDAILTLLSKLNLESLAVKMIKDEWTNYFENSPSNSIIVRTPHSGDATLTKLALETFSEEYRKRIHIIAVAPSAFISPDLCGSVIHICNTRDIVPQLFALPQAKAAGQLDTFKMIDSKKWVEFGGGHSFLNPGYTEILADTLRSHMKQKAGQE